MNSCLLHVEFYHVRVGVEHPKKNTSDKTAIYLAPQSQIFDYF